MKNKNKELPKALTIEELKSRVGKPVFVIQTTEEFKKRTAWYVVSKINEFKADSERHGYIEFTDCNCINFGNTKFFRFFDTEVSTTELAEILEAEENFKKKTGYERVEGAKYYTVSGGLEINSYDDIYEFDEEKYKIANYFNDVNLTKNIARAERLRYRLRRYAVLNGGIPSQKDWQNIKVKKFYIDYVFTTETIVFFDTYCYKTFGQIYFKNKEACVKAMEIFKDELIWYFTEFKEQLY